MLFILPFLEMKHWSLPSGHHLGNWWARGKEGSGPGQLDRCLEYYVQIQPCPCQGQHATTGG